MATGYKMNLLGLPINTITLEAVELYETNKDAHFGFFMLHRFPIWQVLAQL